MDRFLQTQAKAAMHAGKTYKYKRLEQDTDAAEKKALLIGAIHPTPFAAAVPQVKSATGGREAHAQEGTSNRAARKQTAAAREEEARDGGQEGERWKQDADLDRKASHILKDLRTVEADGDPKRQAAAAIALHNKLKKEFRAGVCARICVRAGVRAGGRKGGRERGREGERLSACL